MNYRSLYQNQGFLTGVEILGQREAARHRRILEDAENSIGALHYKSKIHTILRSPYKLSAHPKVLDIVEQLIGHNILLYDVAYIIKEPRSESHFSWHQDLTYWGLNSDDQVSM